MFASSPLRDVLEDPNTIDLIDELSELLKEDDRQNKAARALWNAECLFAAKNAVGILPPDPVLAARFTQLLEHLEWDGLWGIRRSRETDPTHPAVVCLASGGAPSGLGALVHTIQDALVEPTKRHKKRRGDLYVRFQAAVECLRVKHDPDAQPIEQELLEQGWSEATAIDLEH